MAGEVDKFQYQYNPRFESLRNQGISFEDFKAHEEYYTRKLGSTSILDLYKDGFLKADKFKTLYYQTNVFTQSKHNAILQNAAKTHEKITNSLKEWQKEADAKEAQAEEEYILAKEAEAFANDANEKAYNEFMKIKIQFQKNQQSGLLQSKYENAFFKLANTEELVSNANFYTKLSGEHLVEASKHALNTYITSSIAEKTIAMG